MFNPIHKEVFKAEAKNNQPNGLTLNIEAYDWSMSTVICGLYEFVGWSHSIDTHSNELQL